jgi:2-dehydropantoate 2-reductase
MAAKRQSRHVMGSKDNNMNIVILGAGSIGCYLGGCLLAGEASLARTLTFIGRTRLQKDIAESGLTLTDWQGRHNTVDSSNINFSTTHDALENADFILLCVKSQDTQEAAEIINARAKPSAVVVSFQNGVTNGDILAQRLSQKIVKGMVPFNVFYEGNGHFHCGTEGQLAIEDRHKDCGSLLRLFEQAALPVIVYEDIAAVQYSKLIMNLNNAVNALSGIPLKEQLGNRAYRLVMAQVLKEALQVFKAHGITLARTGKVIPKLMPTIMVLPNALFQIVAASTLKIDPQARSSMYEDLVLGRRTEIDFLNGEVERLGKIRGIATPVNSRIIALVKEAERKKKGSPMLAPSQLV